MPDALRATQEIGHKGKAAEQPLRAPPLTLAASSSHGFTLIELVIVIGIMAVLFAITAPSFRGLTPFYRLRTSARNIGSQIELMRTAALSRGLWMGIRYVITPDTRDNDDRPYVQTIPAAPSDFPDQPIEERELGNKMYLERNVRILRVILASNQAIDRGAINILFSPTGTSGSHIVCLEGQDERILSVKMNAITGSLDFIEGAEVGFQRFED